MEDFSIDFNCFSETTLLTIPFYNDSLIVENLSKLVISYKDDISKYKYHEEFKNIDIFVDKENNFIGFTYSRQAYFDKKWTNIEMICRPIIFDFTNGIIVGRGMNKFFNFEELDYTKYNFLKKTFFKEIFQNNYSEKLDGTFAIIFKYNNNIFVATKHGTNTEQAVFIKKHFLMNYSSDLISEDMSLFFECIFPNIRGMEHVFVYKQEGIFLFGGRLNYGDELTYGELKLISDQCAYQMVKFEKFDNPKDFNSFCKRYKKETDKEGYILNIYNKNLNKNLRIKFKTDFFLKKKQIKSTISFKVVKNALLKNSIQSLYLSLDSDDELIDYVDNIKDKINSKADSILLQVLKEQKEIHEKYGFLYKEYGENSAEKRKEYVLIINNNDQYKNNFSYHIGMYDGKDVRKMILKKIDKLD